jgi:isopentenyldiphosphate isomerase
MDDELLDVVDPDDGAILGVKPRAAVHRDGDWHVAFHLWVASPAGVLLQRRARDKASWAGFLDASAAGHLVSGETVADGVREAEEELGVAFAFADLESLGVFGVDEVEQPDRANRELQHVFAARDDRPLSSWNRFQRSELDGLVLIGHPGFATLAHALSGDGPRPEHVVTPARAWDGERERAVNVRASELVPTPYLAAIAPALARVGGARPGA